ncbi:MAG: glycoside hydrolase family 9 protein [Clostridium sp.]|nr:glycoside hydrolase family 9 protein [Clostridium sp.]
MKRKIAVCLTAIMMLMSINVYEAKAADIEANYAKLLQYSLYFYDANMCGDGVDEHSMLSWRGDCHTFDKTTYTRSDGSTVTVDLAGGFHDAGDHVKFGLPEAYAAFVLGMSYDTNREAYEYAGQVGHLQTITTYFADYFVNCTVLSSDGSYVEAFCCQVGQGGGGYDHGYWGAPENQINANRPIYFTSASAPSTDIVCLSAAALVIQYKNFGGEQYLDTAKKLFDYAKRNNKAVNTTANGFYNSTGWEDDYCLAAILLYQVTSDSQYLSEFNNYAGSNNAQKPYWPLGWDNVGPAVAYYNGNSNALSTLMNQYSGRTNSDGFCCIDSWGSARYNTSMQYTGLLYDSMTGTNTNLTWAENQMKYLLGNNPRNQCYVVGYNQYSAKYPHHRAASGYTGGPQGTNTQANVLLGALVGGPKQGGEYTDSANDYQCNEVAIDYNATLVAATAALYYRHIGESDQYIDTNYYVDGTSGGGTGTTPIISRGIYVAENSPTRILAGMTTKYTDKSGLEYRWVACKQEDEKWFEVSGWIQGNEWLDWSPDTYGNIILVCQVRKVGDETSTVESGVGIQHHIIKGICQMPYTGEGGGYLIGVETYNNPNQSFRYELLILDCTLLAEGKDAWIWSTGQHTVPEAAFWAVWQPKYGYYWTLFRIYDEKGNLIDEECYGFVNAY